jgi:hypothetical protein
MQPDRYSQFWIGIWLMVRWKRFATHCLKISAGCGPTERRGQCK